MQTEVALCMAGWEELRARRERYVVQCLGSFGEYMECLALVLAADGVGVMQRLLHAWRKEPILLADLLRLLVALLVHRRLLTQPLSSHDVLSTCCIK